MAPTLISGFNLVTVKIGSKLQLLHMGIMPKCNSCFLVLRAY